MHLQVLQPWDDNKFNFTKALQKEVLFQFEASDMPTKGSSFVPLAPVSGESYTSASRLCLHTVLELSRVYEVGCYPNGRRSNCEVVPLSWMTLQHLRMQQAGLRM